MSTALVAVQPQWDSPQLIATIKETVCKNATDAQFRMFLEVCRATGLNPFLKEIYFAPQIGVIASRDGYLRKANDNPQFDGMETRVERDDKNIPIKAVCTVWRKDRAHPTICEAYYSEYKKSTDVWQKYPSAMIGKVAEVLALKRSFAINGVVTEEEVGVPEERGSKQAQQDYLRSKGIDPEVDPKHQHHQPPRDILVGKGIGIDAGPPMPVERSMPTQGSPDADAVKSPSTTKANKSAMSFKARNAWGELKKEVIAAMGNTDLYYTTLGVYNAKHCTELATKEDAAAAWRLIGAGLNKAKQDNELLKTLQEAGAVLGAEAFDTVCNGMGIDEIMALDSAALAFLLQNLKATADARKSKS